MGSYHLDVDTLFILFVFAIKLIICNVPFAKENEPKFEKYFIIKILNFNFNLSQLIKKQFSKYYFLLINLPNFQSKIFIYKLFQFYLNFTLKIFL